MPSRLYTRRGDSGTTALASGERVAKCSAAVEAYGTLDELNSHVGMLITFLPDEDKAVLREIQQRLFDAGSVLSQSPKAAEAAARLDVEWLEKRIDEAEASSGSPSRERDAALCGENALPHFEGAGGGFHFILPGGDRAAAWAHICRSICRRAERRICSIESDTPEDKRTLAFVNRLSDYFFALSQKINKFSGIAEIKAE